jgi:hypothetical protein
MCAENINGWLHVRHGLSQHGGNLGGRIYNMMHGVEVVIVVAIYPMTE